MRFAALLFALWIPSAAFGQHDSELVNRAFGNVDPIASSEVDPALPPGTVQVRVIDEQGNPVAGAAVRLGIMQSSGVRESEACATDAGGLCEFSDLAMDSSFSYRANVPFEGARYSSMPFRLDPKHGQKVSIRRLPTTTDDRRVFQIVGRTMVEFKEDRARITQDAQLANLGSDTYVFPKGGLALRLPDGFTAFDSRKVMTDQRLSATEEGLSISGSLPPGRVRLTWAYDLPLSGSSFRLEHPIPFDTMEYHVMSDYLDGMTLEVEGFPLGRVVEGADRRFMITNRTRSANDSPLESVRILVRGIPHSQAVPLAAAAIAAILALLGLNMLLRPGREEGAMAKAQTRHRDELLDEIVRLEREHRTEQVGPKYYERRRRELRDELAMALRAQREALDD
jgi:hypothetical protein